MMNSTMLVIKNALDDVESEREDRVLAAENRNERRRKMREIADRRAKIKGILPMHNDVLVNRRGNVIARFDEYATAPFNDRIEAWPAWVSIEALPAWVSTEFDGIFETYCGNVFQQYYDRETGIAEWRFEVN